jgi:hypothetical protein
MNVSSKCLPFSRKSLKIGQSCVELLRNDVSGTTGTNLFQSLEMSSAIGLQEKESPFSCEAVMGQTAVDSG